jgi:hypothetical protein
MLTNVYNLVKSLLLLSPQALSSSPTLGPALDRRLFQSWAKVVANVGAVTGTAPTLTIEIHHSDASGGTYTLYKTLATALAEATVENKVLEYELDLQGANAFLKVNIAQGGTTPNHTIGVTLEALPRTMPANG